MFANYKRKLTGTTSHRSTIPTAKRALQLTDRYLAERVSKTPKWRQRTTASTSRG